MKKDIPIIDTIVSGLFLRYIGSFLYFSKFIDPKKSIVKYSLCQVQIKLCNVVSY